MLDLENTIISHGELKLRSELASALGKITGMEQGIEYLKSELRRVQEDRYRLMLKCYRQRKCGA